MIRLPYFSRSQLGVVLLLGAALLALYAWRTRVFFPSAPPPPEALSLAFVEVTGQVDRPGVYSFPKPPTLNEVLAKAGAAETPPGPDQTIASGSRVEVAPDRGCRVGAMPGSQLLTLGLLIDLNRATAEDLAAIPGLGPALAQRIIDFRKTHGPFKKIEHLREVSGVGPQNLEKLKPYLAIGSLEDSSAPDWKVPVALGDSVPGTNFPSREGRPPGSQSGLQPQTPGRVIDLNLASKADLETLPGIGPVLAQRIIDYRRAHGPYKQIADLRKVSGIGRKKLNKLRPYVEITRQ